MKLFEKVKNMFTEEVEEEVKIEQVPPKVKKENVPNVIDSFEDIKIEKEETKKPVFFTDQDFDDLEKKQQTRKKKVEPEPISRSDYKPIRNEYNQTRSDYNSNFREIKREDYSNTKPEIYGGNQVNIYNDPYKEKKEEHVFKPTPIISPVYGILDKNYHKEDIVSKNDMEYKTVNTPSSIDVVRKKAYGTLEDELENTLFGSNSILFNKKDEDNNSNDDFFSELESESSPDLLNNYENDNVLDNEKKIKDLEEITMDIGKELNSLMNKKDSLKKSETKTLEEDDDDLFNLIDNIYEGDE